MKRISITFEDQDHNIFAALSKGAQRSTKAQLKHLALEYNRLGLKRLRARDILTPEQIKKYEEIGENIDIPLNKWLEIY